MDGTIEKLCAGEQSSTGFGASLRAGILSRLDRSAIVDLDAVLRENRQQNSTPISWATIGRSGARTSEKTSESRGERAVSAHSFRGNCLLHCEFPRALESCRLSESNGADGHEPRSTILTDVSIELINIRLRVFFRDAVAESTQQNCCTLSRKARTWCHKA